MNLFRLFKDLVPDARLDIVTISQVYPDGTSQASTIAGATVVVLGDQYPVGAKVFVRQGQMVGKAPDLTTIEVDV